MDQIKVPHFQMSCRRTNQPPPEYLFEQLFSFSPWLLPPSHQYLVSLARPQVRHHAHRAGAAWIRTQMPCSFVHQCCALNQAPIL